MSWIIEHSEIIKKIAEDFIVAGSGAFAGAYAAQLIAEKSSLRKEILKEIRNANACIALAFGICNSLLNLKGQQVKNLRENYDIQRKQFFEHVGLVRAGNNTSQQNIFAYSADLQTLILPYQPIEILKEYVFNNLTVKGRPLHLTVTLVQTVQSLRTSLELRNSLIANYRMQSLTQSQMAMLYFGAPDSNGHVDMNYPSSVDAIYSQTDDGIYFSQLLCKDLVKYGKQLSEHFKKKFKKVISIDEPDFAQAITAGLMPPEEQYVSWNKAFVERPPELTWMQRLKRWIIGFWQKAISAKAVL